MFKTRTEIEAAICERIDRFQREHMGRRPKEIHAHLVDDLVVVRLKGVLASGEQHLAKTQPVEKGTALLKRVRSYLVETARPILEGVIGEVVGVPVLSLHHDVSTVTGEEVVLFTLAEPPLVQVAAI
jgi:uncharacterized protein YbcI